MSRKQAFSRFLILFAFLYLDFLAACGLVRPQPASTAAPSPSPTASPIPTATPSPSPTPIVGLLIDPHQIATVLYAAFAPLDASYLPENADSDPSNDVHVLGYADAVGMPTELEPKALVDLRVYQPFSKGMDFNKLFGGEGPELVEVQDDMGNSYYVPVQVMKSVLGDGYVKSLSILPEKDEIAYFTMPSQMMLTSQGMQLVAHNTKELEGTIAGDPDTSPIKVSTLSRDLVVLGRYDPMPDSEDGNTDISDDMVLAVLPVYDNDFAGSLGKTEHPVSDFVILKPEDLGITESQMKNMPDETGMYQKTMATWFGPFLGGIVEAYNKGYEEGSLGNWTLNQHMVSPLRMATKVDVDGNEFHYAKTGWVYDIHVFPENTAFSSENKSAMVHVSLNYGRDGEFMVFPLQPETLVAGQGDWNGQKADVIRKPASLKRIAENALHRQGETFPPLSEILILDLTNPRAPFNYLFTDLAYNSARALLGFSPAKIKVVYQPYKGGLPTKKWNGGDWYFSASPRATPETKYPDRMGNAIAYYTSLYHGLVKGIYNHKSPYRNMFTLALDPDILKKMGVEFEDVGDFTPEEIPQDGPVLLELDTDEAMAGFEQTLKNNIWRMGSYVPRFHNHLADGRRVGDLATDMIEALPDGSMVVHNGPGYSPLPVLMKHFIEDEGKDIGFSGSFRSGSRSEPYEVGHNDWKKWIYEYFYQNLSSGKIPEMPHPFDHEETSFTYTDKYLEGGLWTLDMGDSQGWFDAYGDFGGKGRKFLTSGLAGVEDKKGGVLFYNFTITPTSGFVPPWLQTGFSSKGDWEFRDGSISLEYSLFTKYK